MGRMSIRKRISVTMRGFGILKHYCPGLAQGRALYELINSIQPLISVWFSAQIINEISSLRRINTVSIYIVSVVLVNFICSAIKSIINRICNEKESQMWSWFGKIFSDKHMALDFIDSENAKIQHQRQEAEENLYMFGNGLAELVWGTSIFVRSFVNILASVVMTVSLFASKSGNVLIDHPVWIIIVLLCITLGGLSNSKATIKENEVFMKWCKDTVWFNRAFTFFGQELYMNPEKTKDVRIYEQNKIAAKVLDKLIEHDRENQSAIFKMSIFPTMAYVVIGLANIVCCLFIVVKAFYGAFGVGSIVHYAAVLSRLSDG